MHVFAGDSFYGSPPGLSFYTDLLIVPFFGSLFIATALHWYSNRVFSYSNRIAYLEQRIPFESIVIPEEMDSR